MVFHVLQYHNQSQGTGTSSFREQGSHLHIIIPFGDKPALSAAVLLDRVGTEGEAGDDASPGCVLYPELLSWMDKIQRIQTVPFGQLFPQGALLGRCTSQIRCARSPQKTFTPPGEVTEQTWAPPHCCYLTFCMTVRQLPVHSQAFVVGLFGHILAFERCQSAKPKWQ